jgi:hypothetical protein
MNSFLFPPKLEVTICDLKMKISSYVSTSPAGGCSVNHEILTILESDSKIVRIFTHCRKTYRR